MCIFFCIFSPHVNTGCVAPEGKPRYTTESVISTSHCCTTPNNDPTCNRFVFFNGRLDLTWKQWSEKQRSFFILRTEYFNPMRKIKEEIWWHDMSMSDNQKHTEGELNPLFESCSICILVIYSKWWQRRPQPAYCIELAFDVVYMMLFTADYLSLNATEDLWNVWVGLKNTKVRNTLYKDHACRLQNTTIFVQF